MRAVVLVSVLAVTAVPATKVILDDLDTRYVRARIPSPIKADTLLGRGGGIECGIRVFSVKEETISEIKIHGLGALNIAPEGPRWIATPAPLTPGVRRHIGGLTCAHNERLADPTFMAMSSRGNYILEEAEYVLVLDLLRARISYIFME